MGVTAEAALYGWSHPGSWLPDLATGWVAVGCGLTAASIGGYGAPGVLLAVTGFAWFVPDYASSSSGWLVAHSLYWYRGPLVQLVLTYPRRRPVGRVETAAVGAGYAAAVIPAVWESDVATVVLAAAAVSVAVLGRMRATGLARRMRGAAVAATAFLALALAATALVRLALPRIVVDTATLRGFELSLCVLSIGLLVGLLRAPWERPDITDLVVEIGKRRSGSLRDELARALGDPALRIGYWHREAGRFVDPEGRPFVRTSGPGRSLTTVEWGGEPVAVLDHDAAVLADPALLDEIASGSRLAGRNAQLQAEVRTYMQALSASRRRLVEAADAERRRLERLLHGGAESRLARIGGALADAQATASGPMIEQLAQARRRQEETDDALQRLARGLHPRELAEHGLVAALEALASSMSTAVATDLSAIRASAAIESCVFYLCAESLSNVVKYASASHVRLSVGREEGHIVASVEDDGVGGADPRRGTGLRGLRDRVEAFGGSLEVTSPRGAGTSVRASVPAPVVGGGS